MSSKLNAIILLGSRTSNLSGGFVTAFVNYIYYVPYELLNGDNVTFEYGNPFITETNNVIATLLYYGTNSENPLSTGSVSVTISGQKKGKINITVTNVYKKNPIIPNIIMPGENMTIGIIIY